LIIEDKSATGLVGRPLQETANWAAKHIYQKTVTKINNLALATATRPGSISGASSTVPTLTEIQAIRKIEFKIEANFSELRMEVEKQLQQLSKDFPSWQFSAQYGP
jgi:hypothetical protein